MLPLTPWNHPQTRKNHFSLNFFNTTNRIVNLMEKKRKKWKIDKDENTIGIYHFGYFIKELFFKYIRYNCIQQVCTRWKELYVGLQSFFFSTRIFCEKICVFCRFLTNHQSKLIFDESIYFNYFKTYQRKSY